MILNVSGRTDIVAFYSEWFMNRYYAGFVDVRNPFNPHLISRINFSNVEAILFCTKNPIPIVDRLKEIEKPIIFQVTLTPYKKDIEPYVPDKKNVIDSIKKISDIVGVDNIFIRYDPVFISKEYPVDYHLKAFDKLCSELDGYVHKIIISFLDYYKNVEKNIATINPMAFSDLDYQRIGQGFSSSASKHNMTIQTCFEKVNLVEYGFIKGECLSHEYARSLTGKDYPEWKARKDGLCHCVQMVDIGSYNSCGHMCKYCYANFDEKQVSNNMKKHNPNSSLLIGNIMPDDIIKERIK